VCGAFEFRLLCVRVAVADVVGLRELGPPRPAPARRTPTPRAADAAARKEAVRVCNRAAQRTRGSTRRADNMCVLALYLSAHADVLAAGAAGLAYRAAAQRAGA
jgi:hypothetical protein